MSHRMTSGRNDSLWILRTVRGGLNRVAILRQHAPDRQDRIPAVVDQQDPARLDRGRLQLQRLDAGAAIVGRTIVNSAPWCSPARRRDVPAVEANEPFTRASPRPRPPRLRSRLTSAWLNGSKIRSGPWPSSQIPRSFTERIASRPAALRRRLRVTTLEPSPNLQLLWKQVREDLVGPRRVPLDPDLLRRRPPSGSRIRRPPARRRSRGRRSARGR